jgi:hypothetical protein
MRLLAKFVNGGRGDLRGIGMNVKLDGSNKVSGLPVPLHERDGDGDAHLNPFKKMPVPHELFGSRWHSRCVAKLLRTSIAVHLLWWSIQSEGGLNNPF